jgi:ferritin-like metal-binding protein YciE
MPVPRSPEDLLTTELKEIYSAERQLTRALPKLQKQIASERLREMLNKRRNQGTALIEQLDEIFEEMEVSKGRVKNVAAEGLLEDMNQHVEEIKEEKLLDPVLLASLQKVEHYCIAAWGTAASMGRLMGQQAVVETMEKVLEEGKQFDNDLTELAEQEVNPAMLDGGEDQEQEDEDEQPIRAPRRKSQ